jgi:hypothetical protein
MFYQKFIDPLLAPFRAIQNKIVQGRTMKGNFKVDVSRVKNLGANSKDMVKNASSKVNNFAGGQPMQQNGQPGAPAAGAAPAPAAPPPIRTSGFWIFKKKFCMQCQQQLDNTWDQCPYCAQGAAAAAANVPKAALKTQAFVLDSGGNPGSMQLLGWIVPLQGPQRGELFTLTPASVVGTEPTCTVCLQDGFMSQKHAEIKAEGGVWVLRDLGSTNGTYVNNRRVDKHELVDNDFIKFGNAMVKFKSL